MGRSRNIAALQSGGIAGDLMLAPMVAAMRLPLMAAEARGTSLQTETMRAFTEKTVAVSGGFSCRADVPLRLRHAVLAGSDVRPRAFTFQRRCGGALDECSAEAGEPSCEGQFPALVEDFLSSRPNEKPRLRRRGFAIIYAWPTRTLQCEGIWLRYARPDPERRRFVVRLGMRSTGTSLPCGYQVLNQT